VSKERKGSKFIEFGGDITPEAIRPASTYPACVYPSFGYQPMTLPPILPEQPSLNSSSRPAESLPCRTVVS
jgi:hypothetical protein